jgi:hypothetical protein
VGGIDAARRGLRDALIDARQLLDGTRWRLARAARDEPPRRRVLILGVQRPEHRSLARRAHTELLRSRHDIHIHTTPAGAAGKFENLNRLLAEQATAQSESDWLLLIDDDVVLPRGFLDNLLLLAERFAFDLAQPAHRLRSHAAWAVTRRRADVLARSVLARQTRFVEIGPVTLFASSTFATLLPFPPLRMGWGLDLHWAALARTHNWRLGIIDAVALRHTAAPAASHYSREQAITEARQFLAQRPYLQASAAQQTLATYRPKDIHQPKVIP